MLRRIKHGGFSIDGIVHAGFDGLQSVLSNVERLSGADQVDVAFNVHIQREGRARNAKSAVTSVWLFIQ